MPNNVYIGSRYVPIFDGDWDATKNYEGLTIVNYNGSSYTSKGPVPSGTLPTNTTYWALTGNYNGQISNLQQQIDAINNTTIPSITSDIDDINNTTIPDINTRITNLDSLEKFRNKSICIFGDSISDESFIANNWVKSLRDMLADYNCTITNLAASGAGFEWFKYQIRQSILTVPQTDYYIVFLGTNYGTGSWGMSGSEPLLDAIATLVSAIHSANANAKLFFVSPLKKYYPADAGTLNPVSIMRVLLERVFAQYGYNIISGYNVGELSELTKNIYMPDSVHPDPRFSPILASYILNGMINERSNITVGQKYRKVLTNTLGTTSTIQYDFDNNLRLTISIIAYGWSPTTGTWTDLCNLPYLVADLSTPTFWASGVKGLGGTSYRCQNGKLQYYFFNAPSDPFIDQIVFEFNSLQNND